MLGEFASLLAAGFRKSSFLLRKTWICVGDCPNTAAVQNSLPSKPAARTGKKRPLLVLLVRTELPGHRCG